MPTLKLSVGKIYVKCFTFTANASWTHTPE